MNYDASDRKPLLIVEDDQGWRLILKCMMQNMNLEAIYAKSGEDALRILADRDDFSIMIMDVSLGHGMSGLDLGEQIKSELRFKNTPMIATTAHDERVLGDLHDKGFTGYLQKPYSLAQLGSVIAAQRFEENVQKAIA